MTRTTDKGKGMAGQTVVWFEVPALTKEQAVEYDTFHQTGALDSRGKCRVWRRNGATKTWKRDSGRFYVGVKHGMYDYDSITNENAGNVHCDETCPYATEAEREEAREAREARRVRTYNRTVFDRDRQANLIEWSHELGWWVRVSNGERYHITREDLR